MSRLVEQLTRSSQTGAPPIGFRTARAAAPKMLVVAVLDDSTSATPERLAGADAGLLRVASLESAAGELEKAASLAPDIPWGVWLRGEAAGHLAQALELRCDYVVFPAASPALAVAENGTTGMVVQMEPSVPEGQLRALNDLPVDAVLTTGEEMHGALTWHDLMLWRRVSGLLTIPLIACIPAGVGDGQLQLLWETGIRGVVVAAGPEVPAGEMQRLRHAAASITPRPPRRRQRHEVFLPRMEPATGTVAEPDEEEEEEEE